MPVSTLYTFFLPDRDEYAGRGVLHDQVETEPRLALNILVLQFIAIIVALVTVIYFNFCMVGG